MTDKYQRGLYRKFIVERTDGQSAPGEKHEHCSYFVLDWTHDKHAGPALAAYAASCRSDYPALSAQLKAIADALTQSAGLPQ